MLSAMFFWYFLNICDGASSGSDISFVSTFDLRYHLCSSTEAKAAFNSQLPFYIFDNFWRCDASAVLVCTSLGVVCGIFYVNELFHNSIIMGTFSSLPRIDEINSRRPCVSVYLFQTSSVMGALFQRSHLFFNFLF